MWTNERGVAAMLVVGCLALLPGGRAEAFDHGTYDAILRKHVKGGRVDYHALNAEARKALGSYLERLGRAELAGAGRDEKLAFYLNAYNALVLHAILERYPGITSVMKVPGFFKTTRFRVAGKDLSLDELENKLIRPTFRDPRVHFALVCGARSCPPLPSRAYLGATVQRQLDELTRAFINSPAGVVVRDGRPRISALFQWYADDFKAQSGTVGKYLAAYHKRHGPLLARTKDAELGYLDYDWSLNGK